MYTFHDCFCQILLCSSQFISWQTHMPRVHSLVSELKMLQLIQRSISISFFIADTLHFNLKLTSNPFVKWSWTSFIVLSAVYDSERQNWWNCIKLIAKLPNMPVKPGPVLDKKHLTYSHFNSWSSKGLRVEYDNHF